MPEWPKDERAEWAHEQFTRAQTPDALRAPVDRLLATWRSLTIQLDDRVEILRLFNELAHGHALPAPDAPQFYWVDCRPGQIRVGETVRVKVDAYAGPAMSHNGRVCRIVAIRSGDIIVNSIDDGPPVQGVHHPPQALQKRVTRQ